MSRNTEIENRLVFLAEEAYAGRIEALFIVVSIHALLHQQGERVTAEKTVLSNMFQSTPCFISRANREPMMFAHEYELTWKEESFYKAVK